MDYAWARERLQEFIDYTDDWLAAEEASYDEGFAFDELEKRKLLVQEIMLRLLTFPGPLDLTDVVEARSDVLVALGAIEIFTEAERLGPRPSGPRLRAETLHPWVWNAANSFWESEHYAQAVEQAWKSINAHLQQKADRRDVSDDALVNEVLSPSAPAVGRTKIRVPGDHSEPSLASRQRGIHLLGQAAAAGIRNVLAHREQEIPEVNALEYLALLSVLARWIDGGEVVKGE